MEGIQNVLTAKAVTITKLKEGESLRGYLVDILKTSFPKWKSDIHFAAERIGDIRYSQADISKVSSILEFAPQWLIAAGMEGLVESL